MDSPAANTRSRKRARESDSTNDTPANQATEASPQKKRLKLNVGKPKHANSKSGKGGRKSAGTSSAEGEESPAEPAPEIKKSGKRRKGQEGPQKEEEKGGELPLAYPQMPKPDLSNSHVLPEHLEKRLMLPNLKDAKVRRLLEEGKTPRHGGPMGRIRQGLWRATRKATRDRGMSKQEWESEYLEEIDADVSKTLEKVTKEKGIRQEDKELLGEKEWEDEHRAWDRLLNQM